MSNLGAGEYIKVDKVDAFFYPVNGVPVLVCYLEDGRQFTLWQIPPDIVISINKYKGVKEYENITSDQRDSIFDILINFEEFKESLTKYIEKVTIDDMIKEYNVYVATIELKFDGIIIHRRMIPSHAIYLALLANKPIYVKKGLVDEQERENQESGGTNL